MKKVTDGFIIMQTETTTETDTPQFTTGFKLVEWSGGLDYVVVIDGTLFTNGITMEDAKKHNSEIALKYLNENTLTYSEWCDKFN